MPNRIEGIVETDAIEAVLNKLPEIPAFNNPEYSVLVHCMGGQSSGYFRGLWNNDEVKVLWHGWFTRQWWSFFFWFLPGEAALVKVLDRSKTYFWYEDIGGQSFCGLYFVPQKYEQQILQAIKKGKRDELLPLILKDERSFFVLSVDFDMHGGKRDGEVVYRELIWRDGLDTAMVDLFSLIENLPDEELKKVYDED